MDDEVSDFISSKWKRSFRTKNLTGILRISPTWVNLRCLPSTPVSQDDLLKPTPQIPRFNIATSKLFLFQLWGDPFCFLLHIPGVIAEKDSIITLLFMEIPTNTAETKQFCQWPRVLAQRNERCFCFSFTHLWRTVCFKCPRLLWVLGVTYHLEMKLMRLGMNSAFFSDTYSA